MNTDRYIKKDGNELFIYSDMMAEDVYQRVEGTCDVINVGTGDMYELKQQYSKGEKEAIERKRRQKEFKTHNKKFYMFYANRIEYLLESGFTNSELFYVWYIPRKLDYYEVYEDDFVPLINSQKNKVKMNDIEIRKIVGLHTNNKKRVWYDLKNKCIDYGIWKVDEEGYITVNKYFFFRGSIDKNLSKDVIVMKTLTTNTEMKLDSKQQKAIGTFLNLCRFVNPINNSLVRNPQETDESKFQYIQTVSELLEVSGITRPAYKQLWNTEINGVTLIGEWKNKHGKKFVLNYDMVFRGDYLGIVDELTRNKVVLEKLF